MIKGIMFLTLINRVQTLDDAITRIHLMTVDWSGRASCARQMSSILTSDEGRCSLYVSHVDKRWLSLRRQTVREEFEQQFRVRHISGKYL